MEEFARKWDEQYPLIAKSWRSQLGAPGADVWLSTGDPPCRLHHQHHRIAEHEPAQNHQDPRQLSRDEAAFKLLYLALQNIQKKWTMPIPNWGRALNALAILFEERMPTNLLSSFTQNF